MNVKYNASSSMPTSAVNTKSTKATDDDLIRRSNPHFCTTTKVKSYTNLNLELKFGDLTKAVVEIRSEAQ